MGCVRGNGTQVSMADGLCPGERDGREQRHIMALLSAISLISSPRPIVR